MKPKNSKNLLILLAIFVAVVLGFFAFKLFVKKENPKEITRNDAITLPVPQNWILYKTNANYDLDIGYFKNNNKKDSLFCNINAVTAKLGRTPTFEQFLETSLGGQSLLKSHQEVEIVGQKAYRGTYTFPHKGQQDPVVNDRALFVYKGIYTDITLSYSQNVEDTVKNSCKQDFEMFLSNIKLLP
ncbi:MAG TPA: hypothetical protein VLE91_01030 [Candidatus Saccharimonadales bacterium]|nr:hypothetical protein [Candidatus Saccharimonadales bacterium]